MTSSTTQLAAPGWYQDPSGSGRRRWWNGLAWTNHMDDDLVMQGVLQGSVMQPMIPSSVSLNRWPIWVLATLPLVTLVPLLFTDYGQLLRNLALASASGVSRERIQLGLLPLTLVSYGIGFAAYLLTVMMAVLDRHILQRRVGVVRPFHWAWAFLPFGPLVYLIGRAVVLRRRTGQGASWPVWTYVLVSVVVFVVPAVRLTFALSESLPQIAQQLELQQLQLPDDNLDS